MSSTKLIIEIEGRHKYTKKDLENLSEQICNFVSGPNGDGLVVGTRFDDTDKKFEITRVRIKLPEENIWELYISENKA